MIWIFDVTYLLYTVTVAELNSLSLKTQDSNRIMCVYSAVELCNNVMQYAICNNVCNNVITKNVYPRRENSACANVTVFPIPLILAVDRVRHIIYNILGLSHYPNVID